jgi:hypothetical protein
MTSIVPEVSTSSWRRARCISSLPTAAPTFSPGCGDRYVRTDGWFFVSTRAAPSKRPDGGGPRRLSGLGARRIEPHCRAATRACANVRERLRIHAKSRENHEGAFGAPEDIRALLAQAGFATRDWLEIGAKLNEPVQEFVAKTCKRRSAQVRKKFERCIETDEPLLSLEDCCLVWLGTSWNAAIVRLALSASRLWPSRWSRPWDRPSRGWGASVASWSDNMWTLILLTVVLSGSVTGGVATSTRFLDFATEEKCRSAASAMEATERIGITDRGGHPNISPPAYVRTIARCVER